MNDIIDSIIKQIYSIFAVTEESLQSWNGEGNLQFPALLAKLAAQMNWDEKQLREADPIIRFYIRRNPNYHVTRGAHGGIMRASDKYKKEVLKAAKDSAKKQMLAALEAKAASMLANSKNDSNKSEDEDLDNLFTDK